MQVFDSLDPLIAGFIPILAALFFSWWMYHQLTNNRESHIWWKHILQSVKLVPKETADTVGMYDYSEVIENSRALFKWIGVLALVLALWQTFLLVRRQNPYFLWGPKPVEFTGQDGRPALPPRQPGAGGGGATQSGGAQQAPPAGDQTAQPGMQGQPGQYGQPGMQPGQYGQPGMAPGQPSAPGGFGPGMVPQGGMPGQAGTPGMVAPGMNGAPGTGGGGQFNPLQGR
jgi:hypothetical protein